MDFDSALRFILPPGTPGFQQNNDRLVFQQSGVDDFSVVESLNRLQELFPELDLEVLNFYLSENGGDEERTTEELLRSFHVTLNLSSPVEIVENHPEEFDQNLSVTRSGPICHPLSSWSRKLKVCRSHPTQKLPRQSTVPGLSTNLGLMPPLSTPTEASPITAPHSSPTDFTTVRKKKKKKEAEKRSPKTFELDLHGFQVKESLELVSKILFQKKHTFNFSNHNECRLQIGDSLVVITGVGKHSPGRVARIRPALISFLEKHSAWLDWEETNPGAFRVLLLPSPPSLAATAV